MSAARKAKEYGLPSLTAVIEQTGWKRSSLQDMERKYPHRFKIVCQGVKAEINNAANAS